MSGNIRYRSEAACRLFESSRLRSCKIRRDVKDCRCDAKSADEMAGRHLVWLGRVGPESFRALGGGSGYSAADGSAPLTSRLSRYQPPPVCSNAACNELFQRIWRGSQGWA